MLYSLTTLALPSAITSSDLAPGLRGEIWDLVLLSGPVVKIVLLLLILISVCCWGIIFFKYLVVRSAIKESETFLNIFWEGSRLSQTFEEIKDLEQSPLAEVFRTGYLEFQKYKGIRRQAQTASPLSEEDLVRSRGFGIGTIQRALDQAAIAEQTRLEKNLSFLATTATIAPFIGLFGTVWGIMNAFLQIGLKGSASLATVAPGISEALITTAFGLVAAIPAVVAYNYFLTRIRLVYAEMDNFSAEFLNIIERHFEARTLHGSSEKQQG
ncbi:MAG: protein TolQ [Deltaproteobacteria bacterium]|nr:protein TolQ [Deltaproteobacteria bacterium]